mgnify:CR=1 FL=1
MNRLELTRRVPLRIAAGSEALRHGPLDCGSGKLCAGGDFGRGLACPKETGRFAMHGIGLLPWVGKFPIVLQAWISPLSPMMKRSTLTV